MSRVYNRRPVISKRKQRQRREWLVSIAITMGALLVFGLLVAGALV